MKVVLAGGGTAGHIQPALSVAQAIMQNHPDAQLLFLGTSAGLENRLVPEAGFELALITKVSLPRKLSMAVVKAPFQLIKSIRQSRKHLRGRCSHRLRWVCLRAGIPSCSEYGFALCYS